MSLSDLVRKPRITPPRIIVYGEEGIGKTTFAAGAPSPVFVGCEDGLGTVDAPSILTPSWAKFTSVLRLLAEEKHDYRTVVIDTADAITRNLLEPDVIAANQPKYDDQPAVRTVEDIPYGRGGPALAGPWVHEVIPALDRLHEKGLVVIVLAHRKPSKVKNPEGLDYEIHNLRVHEKIADALREWADAVLFADYERTIQRQATGKEKPGEKGKEKLGTGKRILATSRDSGYVAKNRWQISEDLPLEWRALASRVPWFQREAAIARLLELTAGNETALAKVRGYAADWTIPVAWFREQVAKAEAKAKAPKADRPAPEPESNPDAEPAPEAA